MAEQKKCYRCNESLPISRFQICDRLGNRRGICNTCRNKARKKKPEQNIKEALSPENLTTESQGNFLEISHKGKRVKTLADLKQVAEIDEQVWEIQHWKANTWEVARSVGDDGFQIETLHQVKATLTPRVLRAIEFAPIHPVRVELPPVKPATPATGSYGTALIIPDLHVGYCRNSDGSLDPFHDEGAMLSILHLAELAQPDTVVVLGDALDCPDFSTKFLATPEYRNQTQPALNYLASWLGNLRHILPSARIAYLEGNHEARIRNAIASNLSAAYGLHRANLPHEPPVYSVPHLLGLDGMGIEYSAAYPHGRFDVSPVFSCIHGEAVRSGTKPMVDALLKGADRHICCGHIHRLIMGASTKYWRGEPHQFLCFSPGTLARLPADSQIGRGASNPDWQRAIALAHYERNGIGLSVEIVPWLGRFVWRGMAI